MDGLKAVPFERSVLRREAPGGIQCRPRLLPAQPCEPGSRSARRECVRVAGRVPAFAARAAHVPGHSSYDPPRSKRLDPPTLAALQPICSPSLLPYLYGTSIPPPDNPDFLLRDIRQDRMCGFLRGKPHTARQRHQPRQEIRGGASFATFNKFKKLSRLWKTSNCLAIS
jgi:hypothetical protein